MNENTIDQNAQTKSQPDILGASAPGPAEVIPTSATVTTAPESVSIPDVATGQANLAVIPKEQAAILAKVSTTDIVDAEIRTIHEEAIRYVDEAGANRQDLTIIDKFSFLGEQSQISASRFLDRSINELKDRSTGKKSGAPVDIISVRREIDQINPASIERAFWVRLLNVFGLGEKLADRAIRKIYQNESIAKNIDALSSGLIQTKEVLRNDSAGLAVLNEDLRNETIRLRRNQLVGKNIFEESMRRFNVSSDPQEKAFWEKVSSAVIRRVQTLYMAENMLLQNQAAIYAAHEGNTLLIQTIDELVYLVVRNLRANFAIRVVLENQAKAIEAAAQTGELLTSSLEQNAKLLDKGADRIIKLAGEGAVDVNRVVATCNQVVGTLGKIQNCHQGIINIALQTIPKLEAANQSIQDALPSVDGKKDIQQQIRDREKAKTVGIEA